jgi:hypothetical protein
MVNKDEDSDTHSYKGWLNSDSWWKRAAAIQWYSFAFWIVVYGIIFILAVIFGILTGTSGTA